MNHEYCGKKRQPKKTHRIDLMRQMMIARYISQTAHKHTHMLHLDNNKMDPADYLWLTGRIR